MMTFLELCKQRFAVRKYEDKPVEQEDLDYIFEAMRMAPSAVNRQPWKFLIVKSEDAKDKLRECYDRPWFKTAPIYIICLKDVNENWIRPADGKAHGDIDLGIVTEHLCLAAAERGLGTCWVCNYDTEKINRYFGSEQWEAVAIVPLGYIADDCPQNPKKRKALEEIVETI